MSSHIRTLFSFDNREPLRHEGGQRRHQRCINRVRTTHKASPDRMASQSPRNTRMPASLEHFRSSDPTQWGRFRKCHSQPPRYLRASAVSLKSADPASSAALTPDVCSHVVRSGFTPELNREPTLEQVGLLKARAAPAVGVLRGERVQKDAVGRVEYLVKVPRKRLHWKSHTISMCL